MTLCDFYIHDYEVFDDTSKVKSILEDELTSLGFIESTSKSGCVTWNSDTISISDLGFHNDIYTLESCIPIYCNTKVCVKCGKVKSSYDIEKVKQTLMDIIKYKTEKYERRIKARSLIVYKIKP